MCIVSIHMKPENSGFQDVGGITCKVRSNTLLRMKTNVIIEEDRKLYLRKKLLSI